MEIYLVIQGIPVWEVQDKYLHSMFSFLFISMRYARKDKKLQVSSFQIKTGRFKVKVVEGRERYVS